MKVLVTHPGRQHSHQTALALEEAGMLAGYWAGAPCLESQGRFVPRALWRRLVRYDPVPLPPERVRWVPWTPALRRLGDRLLPARWAAANDLRACRLFDRWAARRLARERGGVDAVIACEISALETFRTARRLGIATLLDAPSIHRLAQDRVQPTADSMDLHCRIAAVKDEEVALADHVLTVSDLARATYIAAGVPEERVHSVTLGADLEIFAPAEPDGSSEGPANGGFTFLFAGAPIPRKGFDLLLAAFAEVRGAVPGARLRLVGPRGDAPRLVASRGGERISLAGPLDQRGLAAELHLADCLVLPSRHDSFGMVVAEALAAGVPALVSGMVGAKDLVREGENGWIVPVDDAAALAQRMLWCASRPREIRAMRAACRLSAAGATWLAHHRRLVELMRTLLPEPR